MSEIEIKHLKSYSDIINSLPEDERKCAEIMCKQSAEAQEERLFLAQLQQSKSTYLVCFDNGYVYGHVSALELYNFQKLKIEYNKILEQREQYIKSLYNPGSTVIVGDDKIELVRKYNNSLQSQIDPILKTAQLFIMPFNREIEKIIDETTNTVVKI